MYDKQTKTTGTDEVWITKDGCEIEVKDMTAGHIRNALRHIIRKLKKGEIRYSTLEDLTGCDATHLDIW